MIFTTTNSKNNNSSNKSRNNSTSELKLDYLLLKAELHDPVLHHSCRVG